MQETQVQFLGQEDALVREMATPLVFSPGECHGQRGLAGYRLWDRSELGHDLRTKNNSSVS